MKTFLIFALALCAVCHAAPGIKEADLDHPSPIPPVLSDPKPAEKVVPLTLPVEEPKHRQKRDEDAPSKPHSVAAHGLLRAQPLDAKHEKPAGVVGHEALQHDPKKLKRESQSKPASVTGRDAVQHDGHSHTHDALVPHSEKADPKTARHQRDIPVPTEVKPKATIKDEEKPQVEALPDHVPTDNHDHPHSPLRHHPVPVAELFNKPKIYEPSSSVDAKEGKETKA